MAHFPQSHNSFQKAQTFLLNHILLVGEQTADTFSTVSRHLKLPMHIMTASHGQEALDLLNTVHVDILIADEFVPDMPGSELIHTLRKRGLATVYTILFISDEIYVRALSFHSRFAVDMYLNPQQNPVLNAPLLQQALKGAMNRCLS